MKKTALLLGLCLSQINFMNAASSEEINLQIQQVCAPTNTPLVADSTTEPEVFTEALVREIHSIPFSFLELPFWAKARCIGVSAFGAIMGNLSAVALLNIVGYKNMEVNIPNPTLWGKMEWLGTIAGTTTGVVYAYSTEYPSGISKKFDQNLLIIALKSNNDSQAVIKNLNSYFAMHQFPHMSAFLELQNMFANLSYVMELIKKLEQGGKTGFTTLKKNIELVLEAVKFAMITVKTDPHWLQECQAHSMQKVQANMESQQNAQLVSSIIQFAHKR